MNAAEHLAMLAERRALALRGSLLATMYEREGVEATDDAVRRGLRVWAIERRGSGNRPQTTIVFGRSGSDALRRASAPARLGESIHGELTLAAEILSGLTEPVASWERFTNAVCSACGKGSEGNIDARGACAACGAPFQITARTRPEGEPDGNR